jgi:hypothetical protein
MSERVRLQAPRSTARGPSRPRVDAACPSMLSPETWTFLAHHVERAFTRPGTWRSTLRGAVRRVTLEMEAVGADPAVVRLALQRSVMEHAACARYDRMLIVTRARYSEGVIAAMHEWAEADLDRSPSGTSATRVGP